MDAHVNLGDAVTNPNLRRFLAGSSGTPSDATSDERVQGVYRRLIVPHGHPDSDDAPCEFGSHYRAQHRIAAPVMTEEQRRMSHAWNHMFLSGTAMPWEFPFMEWDDILAAVRDAPASSPPHRSRRG